MNYNYSFRLIIFEDANEKHDWFNRLLTNTISAAESIRY